MLSMMSMNPVSHAPRAAALAAALVALAMTPATRANEPVEAIAWHADLPQALRAAERSQRPVLAIFTASWSSAGTTLERTALASDEAVALVAACFEPVCVDIDTNPEATRRHGVNRVPTVCVITPQDQLLTSFDLPEHPAHFVALAARAAQSAAAVLTRSGGAPPEGAPNSTAAVAADVPSATVSALGSDLGDSLLAPRQGAVAGAEAPVGRSVSAVAAKVRKLSDFASGDAATAGDSTVTASYRDDRAIAESIGTTTPDPRSLIACGPSAATPAPTMVAAAPPAATSAFTAAMPSPPTPVAIAPAAQQPAPTAAEPATATASTVAASPLGIEPAPSLPTTPAAGSTPWLGGEQRPQPSAAPATVAATPQPARPIEPQAAPGGTGEGVATDKPKASPPSTAASFMAALQKPFSLFTRQPQPAKSEPKTGATTAASSATASTRPAAESTTAATGVQPDAYGSMPLGLEGYCPVTLAERGAWVEGRAQWGARHRGRTYLFAGLEQQQAFLSDPDRYAPVLSGDDPVLAFDNGRSTPGQRRYGVTYQSRMYLFSSTETRDAFAANPQRYTTGAVVAENRAGTGTGVVR